MLHNLSILLDDSNRSIFGAPPSHTTPPLPFPFTRRPPPTQEQMTGIAIGILIVLSVGVVGGILFYAIHRRGCCSPRLPNLPNLFGRPGYADIQSQRDSDESRLINPRYDV